MTKNVQKLEELDTLIEQAREEAEVTIVTLRNNCQSVEHALP